MAKPKRIGRATTLALAMVAVLALVPSASAVQTVTPDGQIAEPFQQWVNARSGWLGTAVIDKVQVEIVNAPCSQFYPLGSVDGCAGPGYIQIARSVLAYPKGERRLSFVFWHEMGHQFDFANLTAEDRAAFAAAVGRAGWGGGGYSAQEEFADAYARIATLRSFRHYREWYGHRPTQEECAVGFCPRLKRWQTAYGIIARLGGVHG